MPDKVGGCQSLSVDSVTDGGYSICGYCSFGCGLRIGVDAAVAVRGNDWPPTNNGRVCVKGLYEHKVLDSPHVITMNIMVVAEENRVMTATVVIYSTCLHYQVDQDNYCSISRENARPYSGRRISIVRR